MIYQSQQLVECLAECQAAKCEDLETQTIEMSDFGNHWQSERCAILTDVFFEHPPEQSRFYGWIGGGGGKEGRRPPVW